MEKFIIPARSGIAFHVSEGQSLRLITPEGRQTADFFAFREGYPGEWLSTSHTMVTVRHFHPRPPDCFYSRFRRPMLDFIADHSNGTHDLLVPACDQMRYELLGWQGPHANCADNLRAALARLGIAIDVIPQPINFFMPIEISPEGDLYSPDNNALPGAYVELRARMDLICAVSACPFDLIKPGWGINAPSGPTGLEVEVF